MPRLTELEAKFIKQIPNGSQQLEDHQLQEADGIIFLCPCCYVKAGDANVGVHSVICWFVGKVSVDTVPGPGRWNPRGTCIDDLTFVGPGNVSVFLTSPGGCGWHGHIRNGEATLN